MKSIKNILSLLVIVTTLWSCADDEKNVNLNNVQAPSALAMAFDVTQDNTGLVTITPTAEGAVSFDIALGDGTAEAVELENGQNTSHTYAEGTYTVTATAYGITGLSTSLSQELVVSFQAPENLQVTIENDVAVSKQVNVTVTADFAITFDVYSGESGNNDPVSANIGETAILQYNDAGIYDITIEVKGAAIQTTTEIVEFEVTEILAPIASATAPPARQPEDVISIFSSAYTDVALTNYFPDWGQGGQGSSWAMFDLAGDEMLQYINLSYQGIALADGTTVDVSNMEYLHLDVWTSENGDITDLETSIINNAGGTVTEAPVTSSLTAGQWTSIEIPITDYTDQGLTVTEIFQMKFVGTPWAAGTVFIDNIYFYKEPTDAFDDGLLTNGDFELGSDSWLIGVDDASSAPVVTDADGNQHYSVDVTNAGDPWSVNTSQKVEIINGQTYTLIFDAWSDTNRPILAGLGLSAGPWTNVVETVNITTTRTTYSYTFDAVNFGDPQARVLFDLGAAAGQVNLDNVALFLGNGPFNDGLLNNGDFELGSESWLIGVDDSTEAPVVTDADGNQHYSVDVTNAGDPWSVNTSQKVEIITGSSYTLTFDAWSDTNRPILAGLGLSAGPWTNVVETVDITTTRTTYSLTFNAVTFGDPQARVLFDLGAAVGQVNLDNVSLVLN
ncbi:MAG: carbohydrate binding domain-containing protein [Flavobacteriaceae bacterium]